MLIPCPRCGFSQPEDQYCAQCGVNMQSFKPIQKPTFKKVVESLGFQVFILLLIASFAGSYLIRSDDSPKWVQKLTRFQGVTQSKTSVTAPSTESDATGSSLATEAADGLTDLTNKEILIEENSAPQGLAARGAAPEVASAKSSDTTTADTSTVLFKLTYAEVSAETLARWVAESSRLGLYQALPGYAAGILPDFKKRGDSIKQILKSSEKKLALGQNESNLSGLIGEDGQMIGLSVTYDFRSFEGSSVHGTISVTRANQQQRENFPAEFDLPKGAAFIMVDTIGRQNFSTERNVLNMAPFQILKSSDFMTQKTKFVIILEPDFR